jgi:Protein of unknown function (DUF2949)
MDVTFMKISLNQLNKQPSPHWGQYISSARTCTDGFKLLGVLMMATTTQNRLLGFLKEELLLPSDSIDLALRHCNKSAGSLPIILWHYGLITLEQLSRIYDWLETV